MAEAPTPDEIGALLGETGELDAEPVDPYADENGEFMAAATAAVGSETKATALKDAITACLREHGLIGGGDEEAAEGEDAATDSEVGEGFEDY